MTTHPMIGHTYAGDYKSAIARAKRVLLKAGFAWSHTTGHYTPFDNTQKTTDGVKVTRIGVSETIALHVQSKRFTDAARDAARDLAQRALEALRAAGMPFDDRGWLACGADATRINARHM